MRAAKATGAEVRNRGEEDEEDGNERDEVDHSGGSVVLLESSEGVSAGSTTNDVSGLDTGPGKEEEGRTTEKTSESTSSCGKESVAFGESKHGSGKVTEHAKRETKSHEDGRVLDVTGSDQNEPSINKQAPVEMDMRERGCRSIRSNSKQARMSVILLTYFLHSRLLIPATTSFAGSFRPSTVVEIRKTKLSQRVKKKTLTLQSCGGRQGNLAASCRHRVHRGDSTSESVSFGGGDVVLVGRVWVLGETELLLEGRVPVDCGHGDLLVSDGSG